MDQRTQILILDDDRAVCSSLKLLLQRHHYIVHAIHTPQLLEDALLEFQPEVVLLDMNFTIETSGVQGLKALELILQKRAATAVILMTGWATVELAVKGMKLGARDFIAKPWDNKSLLQSIQSLIAVEAIQNNTAITPTAFPDHIVGQNKVFRAIIEKAIKIAPTDASVLITGESGTGKEVLAELIHRYSKRNQHEFIKVNLGGISSTLFESEMYGHKKGAFTGAYTDRIGRFELADKGTIFLDEIGELDPSNQVKLLRVLQEKTFEPLGSSRTQKTDTRVISATNRTLPQMIQDGSFREDLYYRINLIQFHLPPLRERREDIPLLVEKFRKTISDLYNLPDVEISKEALEWLTQQTFTGNIRELRNWIERTLLLHIGVSTLESKHFKDCPQEKQPQDTRIQLPDVGSITLEEMERQMIMKTLEFCHYSVSRAAQALGITRSSLYRRMEKYHIPYESK